MTLLGRNRNETLAGMYGKDQEYGITRIQRRSNIRKHLIYAAIELLMVCLSVSLIINYAPNDISFFKIDDGDFR